ncbi:MAG: J domain-containing protein [Desulfobulbaceae bacterium]|nr:J domain-containing protein [Desulfobulbaceae bacterium]
MKTPFEILEVKESATDEEIKKAYLAMVKRYPPEQCSEQFQRIRRAYELIHSAEKRIAHRLFHAEMPDRQDCYEKLFGTVTAKRPDTKWLAAVLEESLKNYRLPAE